MIDTTVCLHTGFWLGAIEQYTRFERRYGRLGDGIRIVLGPPAAIPFNYIKERNLGF